MEALSLLRCLLFLAILELKVFAVSSTESAAGINSYDQGKLLAANQTDEPAYLKPSNLPTSYPTNSLTNPPPTSQPSTSSPSSLQPSSSITGSPSSLKTEVPTNLPTAPFHSTEPTSLPSSTPTNAPVVPSSYPSSFPSSSPSSSPSSKPTIHTQQPSSRPTARPSAAPTPNGVAGKNWWYFLSTDVTLYSKAEDTFSVDDLQEIIDALDYAFLFEYKESLSVSEGELITVVVDSSNHYRRLSTLRRRRKSIVGSSSTLPQPFAQPLSQIQRMESANNYTAKFVVNTWSSTKQIQKKLYWKTLSLQENPTSILLILHEQDFKDISTVQLSNPELSTTSTPPPSEDSNLSPDRIIYIIIGTVVLFAIGTLIVGGCFKVAQKSGESLGIGGKGREFRDEDDGDVMMTSPTRRSPRSPNSPSSRSPSPSHRRSLSAPAHVLSPIHQPSHNNNSGKSRGSSPQRQIKQQQQQQRESSFEDYDTQQSNTIDQSNSFNPLYSQKSIYNNINNNTTATTTNNTVSSFSSTNTAMKVKDKGEEDVFDFRFDDFNLDDNNSKGGGKGGKYSKGLSNSNDADEEDADKDYDLDDADNDGDVAEDGLHSPSRNTFSFFGAFSSHNRGGRSGGKKRKNKVDYESLVF